MEFKMIFLFKLFDELDLVFLFFMWFKVYIGVLMKFFYGSYYDFFGMI